MEVILEQFIPSDKPKRISNILKNIAMVFGVLASTIVMYYSRQREFKADSGSASLVGKHKMIAALQKLQKTSEPQLEGSLMAFGISGKKKNSLFHLFQILFLLKTFLSKFQYHNFLRHPGDLHILHPFFHSPLFIIFYNLLLFYLTSHPPSTAKICPVT